MPYPRVADDGQTVDLDVHGATVREASDMIARLVSLAITRGRSTVRIIHGASTSEIDSDKLTIRTRLLELLEEGTLSPDVVSWFTFDTSTTLSLPQPTKVDRTKIVIYDLL